MTRDVCKHSSIKSFTLAWPYSADGESCELVFALPRDARLAGRRQGYRLHVDARAGLALEQCLPPESLALFQATCGDVRAMTSGTTVEKW